MQKTYVMKLYNLMKKNPNVISCLSDSGTDYDEMIAREMPNQFLNFGISENNKVAAAAGLASCGKIPFVYTTNAFLAYRSYEFIRDDICLQNKNVKLIGMGCGLSWSTLGSTHHTTEDISALKALPNLVLLSPASPKELEECMEFAYNYDGPVYIRIGMGHEKEIYDEHYNFELNKIHQIKDGTDATIFTTGSIISDVIEAAKKLEEENISIKIINIPVIKPMPTSEIEKECKKQTNIISIEEHNTIGGLGSSIADVIATSECNCRLIKIGLEDKFASGYGTHEEVKEMNGLSSECIYKKIKSSLKKER